MGFGGPAGFGESRVEHLAFAIVRAHENKPQLFQEFADLLRRLRLAKHVAVEWFDPPKRDDGDQETWAFVNFDGKDLAVLSDGTLRTCEIILELLSLNRSVLWIEEPESGIHPGLLDELLGVIESYSRDRQVVMATHSPYVVRRCDPADIRLVERVGDSTRVRGLAVHEVERVEAYLNDEGSLDEYIFATTELDDEAQ
jgi:predicted ATPase